MALRAMANKTDIFLLLMKNGLYYDAIYDFKFSSL